MYRIGEFSLINKVSVKTLRYYDTIGLFKPKIVDEFTGYRFYDDDQQEVFDEIMKYKNLGIPLEEIKKIINADEEKKKVIIDKYIYNLNKELVLEESKKTILKNIVNGTPRVEFVYYYHKPYYVKKYTLDNRDADSIYEEIKKDLNEKGLKTYRKVFDNYEIGYCTENIDALLGFEVDREIGRLDDYKLFWLDLKTKSLVGRGKKDEIDNIYRDIVLFAKENNYQIRGSFIEIYDNDDVEVSVEAFNLNEDNNDYIDHLSRYKPDTEINKYLIGKYKIREILPHHGMFNPKKQKSLLDTKFDILELKPDGTTNFENIKWGKKDLLFNYDNRIIPVPMRVSKEDDDEYYLVLLFNEDFKYYKSQRPMHYIYEKIE